MKLIVGLGNPGPKYVRNRHNIGCLAADAIARAHAAASFRAKFQGEVAEVRFATGKALILKPETFMNFSGDSVRAALDFHKLTPGDVIVLHDELDLAPGRVRVKTGGGHAGHNGLRSIIGHIGPDFTRVRLGIGHPGDKALVSNHVLSDFTKAEAEWLEPLLTAIAQNAPDLAAGDIAHFASVVGQASTAPDGPVAPPLPLSATNAPPDAEDGRTPLQKLIDRFR